MTFLAEKARTRRNVHRAFAVPCLFGDDSVALTARFHDKMSLGGDIEPGVGYANIIEGITRVIFDREELAAADGGFGVTPTRGDRIVFPDYMGISGDLTVELDARDPYDGPIDEKWSVAVI